MTLWLSRLRQEVHGRMSSPDPTGPASGPLFADPSALHAFTTELERARSLLPPRVNADPQSVDHGLAKLVLTVVELLRQLLERQAVRRIEAGSLTDAEIDRLGQTFLRLNMRMEELKRVFGLEDEDLNLHLGPLGDLR